MNEQIYINKYTYIRNYDQFSLVYNIKNYAGLIIQDGNLFLEHITYSPVERNVIFKSILSELEIDCNSINEITEIEEDFSSFIEKMITYGFIQAKIDNTLSSNEATCLDSLAEKIIDDSTFYSFCLENMLPMELHIDLTSSCNERCVHCYMPDYSPKYFEKEFIFKVINEFRDANGLRIILSGGEPMLHPDFAEILHYASQKNLIVKILSNMSCLTPEIEHALRSVSIESVQVSLFSIDPDQHDAITSVAGSWRRTMAGIEFLQENDIPVLINCPVLKQNYIGFGDLWKFCQSKNLKIMANYGEIYAKTNNSTTNLQYTLSPQEAEYFVQENLSKIQDFSPDNNYEPIDPDASPCEILMNKINIDSSGNYYPCDGFHAYGLGNCKDVSLDDVWHSSKVNYLRSLRNKDLPDCLTCKTNKYCKVCFMRNYNHTRNVLEHSPDFCIIPEIRSKVLAHALNKGPALCS